MKNEKNINYKHIGNVLYHRNGRARNISIRINSKGEVNVTVPGSCSYQRAEQFVLEKEEWIKKKILTIQKKTEEEGVWRVGDSISILNGKIDLSQGTKSEFEVMQAGNNFIIELPLYYDEMDEERREELFYIIGSIGIWVAKQYLPAILARLSEQYELPYTRLTVRRMRTRWGSCSSKNNISLNSALVFLSDELLEYVCLHELVHTVHKDHSAAFWNALVVISPEALSLRKKLGQQMIIA